MCFLINAQSGERVLRKQYAINVLDRENIPILSVVCVKILGVRVGGKKGWLGLSAVPAASLLLRMTDFER